MTTGLDYICSQYYGVKGAGLLDYYRDTAAKVFDLQTNKVFLGDEVVSRVDPKTREATINDADRLVYKFITLYQDREIIEHQLWNDKQGNIHEWTIQAIKDYTGGDAVLNHYHALLLWAQSQGVRKFYSDISLSPGTMKIYSRLEGLGWDVIGPCEIIDSIDDSGQVTAQDLIYYINLSSDET